MSLPFPISHLILALNQLPLALLPHMLLRSLHHLDSLDLSLLLSKPFQDPYFGMMISRHSPLSPLPNLHFHLPRKALLKQAKSLIPRSPLFLLLQIVSHLIQAIFFLHTPNPTETSSLTLLPP